MIKRYEMVSRLQSVEIPGHVTPGLDVTCALLMRSYINRSFFHSTLKAIQLSVLLHILIGYKPELVSTLL